MKVDIVLNVILIFLGCKSICSELQAIIGVTLLLSRKRGSRWIDAIPRRIVIGAALNGHIQGYIPRHVLILSDENRFLEVAAGDHIVRCAGSLSHSVEQDAAIKGTSFDHCVAFRVTPVCFQCEILPD